MWCVITELLGGWILLDDLPDFALVCRLVLLEQIKCVGLRRRLWVGFVEQRLNTQQDLFDIYRGLPAFFFVEDGEADGARGVNVGVE